MRAATRRSGRGLFVLGVAAASVLGCACRQRAADHQAGGGAAASRAEGAADGKGKRDMEPKINRDCDFTKVERTFTAYPCTPVLGPQHENVIRINAPEEVTFVAHNDDPLGEDTRFVICGALQMRTDTLEQLGIRGDELDKIMLVAVDARSNKTYSGTIGYLGTREPMPDDLKKPSPPGYLIGEAFNPNLVRSFDLPPVETDYFVHAVLGPFKSNVLKIRLRRAK